MKVSDKKVKEFQTTVLDYYKTHGRHALPWRETHDPYHILVSEVMLQQTQVARVIPYFTRWLSVFPDVHTLAKVPFSKVLRMWQGLGYNRRAKMLHQCAKMIVKEYKGVFPKKAEALQKLPGVGSYTAGAVTAFAYNHDTVFIETNIRTVVMHHFFTRTKKVNDAEIMSILEKVFPKGKARIWYSALMDYGAHLKKSGVRINTKAKGYVKQKKFAGSDREARGAILKALVQGPKPATLLINLFGTERRGQLKKQLPSLTKEGLIILKNGNFRIPP